MTPNPKANEILLTRVYDAPVSTVWEAWTDPAHAAHWWGPRGFTLTTHSKDLRPGGAWRYTMHGPDGVDYPSVARYHEVEDQAKLLYDHGGSDDRPPLFRVLVRFTPLGKKTRMDMTVTLATPEAAEEIRKFIKKVGGDSTWDRLAEYLAKGGLGKDIFVIARAFDAPLERVFDMWTDPKHVAQWLPPQGATMEYIKADIRPGGDSLFAMSLPNGQKMYGRVSYREISRPERIVYAQQFTDEKGQVARHPLSATWPETMLTTVTFASESPTRTRVAITWEPEGAVTAGEIETFITARGGMTQGWTGSLDKLEDVLGRSP
jgi:uncharacterized protein YndB with AHSA1/START domain